MIKYKYAKNIKTINHYGIYAYPEKFLRESEPDFYPHFSLFSPDITNQLIKQDNKFFSTMVFIKLCISSNFITNQKIITNVFTPDLSVALRKYM